MGQEPFGTVEVNALPPDGRDAIGNHLGASALVPVQHSPDLRETHANSLAGQNDPATAHVFVRIVSMPRTCPVGHNDAFVLPMSQHVRGHPEFVRRLTYLHPPIMPS